MVAIAVVAGACFEARDVRAQGPGVGALPVAIDVSTSDSCPADRFRNALESRVRRRLDLRAGASATLRVTIAGVGNELEGTASFNGASGAATRSVRGSCEETTAALALIAATWLEAEPAVEPERAPEPPAPPSPPAEPIAPPPAPPVVPPRVAPPSVELRAPTRWALGAHGLGTFGLVGSLAGGAAVSFAYETERFELRGGIRGALTAETIPSGKAHYAWLTAALDGCAHALAGRGLRLAGCVRIEPGYFRVSFSDTERSLPWLSASLAARLGWLVGPVRLEIETSASLPITGYRVTRTDASLVPFKAFAPGFAAGVMIPF